MNNKQLSGSLVWNEFLKIAKENGLITTDLNPENKDFVGNPSKSPVGPFRMDATEDYKESELCDLFEKAHKKRVEVADAMGDGGVVENEVEQQKKDIEIATNMPSGALVGVHAELIKELAKKANELDAQGKIKEANRIDEVLEKISKFPFDNGHSIKKQAFLGVPALIWWGISAATGAATAANLGFFSSWRENIGTDAQDLFDILKDCAQEKFYGKASPTAQRGTEILQPFLSQLKSFQVTSEEDVAKTLKLMEEFRPVLEQLKSFVPKIEIELGESRWFEFGRDRVTRLKAKLNDVEKDYEFVLTGLNAAHNKGQEYVQQKQQKPEQVQNNIPTLQDVLIEQNLLTKKTGTLDNETISAVQKLEQMLDEKLSNLGIIEKGKFTNRIIRNNNIAISPKDLRRIIELIPLVERQSKK